MLSKRGTCLLLAMGSLALAGPARSEELIAAEIKERLASIQAEIDELKSHKPKLKCRIVTSPMTVAPGINQETKVLMPSADVKGGYELVGGGCYVVRAVNMLRRTMPTPAEDGWRCELVDLPNMRENSSVQAAAIYCKVE